jgi:hypothetical protein
MQLLSNSICLEIFCLEIFCLEIFCLEILGLEISCLKTEGSVSLLYVRASCAEVSRAAGATRLLSHPVEEYLQQKLSPPPY